MIFALLDELCAWLATAAGLVVGQSLFVGGLPPTSDIVVSAVIPTGGLARENKPFVEATFQVLTRGVNESDIQGCLTQAGALYDATLAGALPVNNVMLTSFGRVRIEAVQPPADLGIDAAGKRRVVFNLLVRAAE